MNEPPPSQHPFQRTATLACPKCSQETDVRAIEPFEAASCPACDARFTVPAKFGDFLLIKPLRQDDGVTAYLARDRKLGRQVAVKIVEPSAADDEAMMQRLSQRARALASLSHPRVVHVYAAGDEQGAPFLVTEQAGRKDLHTIMSEDLPLDEAWTLQMALDAAQGLGAAHEIGLAHGDVRPANIVFDRDGSAKITDFDLLQSENPRRQAQHVLRYPLYVAPEIVRGKLGDFQSDMYSLGAVMYHCLTGRPPFAGAEPKAIARARLGQPAPDPQHAQPLLHGPTSDVVTRMLAPDPASRYPDYQSLVSALKQAIAEVSEAPTEAAPSITYAPPVRRRSSKVLIVYGLLLAVGFGVLLGLLAFGAMMAGGLGAPSEATPIVDAFDGSRADPAWRSVGQGGFVRDGIYRLKQFSDSDEMGVTRLIGQGSFSCTIRLSQLTWGIRQGHRLIVTFDDQSGNTLEIALSQSGNDPATLAAQTTRGYEVHAESARSVTLESPPVALTLQIDWDEGDKQWRVAYAFASPAAAADDPASSPSPDTPAAAPPKLGPMQELGVFGAARGSSERRAVTIQIEGRGGRAFSVDMDQFELQ